MQGSCRDTFQVVVGSIGIVYSGDDAMAAQDVFASYVRQSQGGYGKGAFKAVALMDNGMIWREHRGRGAD